jgi:hypothetical protein
MCLQHAECAVINGVDVGGLRVLRLLFDGLRRRACDAAAACLLGVMTVDDARSCILTFLMISLVNPAQTLAFSGTSPGLRTRGIG